MRFSGISRIIEAGVKPQAEADNANRGLNNSRYFPENRIQLLFYYPHGLLPKNDLLLITTKKSNRVSQDKMF